MLIIGLGDLQFQKTRPDTTNEPPDFLSHQTVFSSPFPWLVTALKTIPGTPGV